MDGLPKVRARDPGVVAVPSAIGSLYIFKELSVDYIGSFPTDEVGLYFEYSL